MIYILALAPLPWRPAVRTHISKWGNSLAVRILKAFTTDAGLEDGHEVEITLEGGRIVVTPVGRAYRQHRHQRRRDWRRLRRREGNRGRARVGIGFVEALHAPPDQHHQLEHRIAPGPGPQVRLGQSVCLHVRQGRGHNVASHILDLEVGERLVGGHQRVGIE